MKLLFKSSFLKSLTFGTVVSFCIVLFLQSCDESEFEMLNEPDFKTELKSTANLKNTSELQSDEFRFYNKIYKIPEGLTRWEAQLNEMIDHNYLIKRSNLELMGYDYIRQIVSIEDLEKVKTEFINNHNSFPVYGNDQEFTIQKEERISKKYSYGLNTSIPTSEEHFQKIAETGENSLTTKNAYIFEKNDLSMVKLEWEYKGNKLKTKCLVSENKGFVFDRILSFLSFHLSEKTNNGENLLTTIPRLKSTNTESDPIAKYHFWKHRYSGYILGAEVWYADFDITTEGEQVDSIKSITGKHGNLDYDADFPFYIDAEFSHTSFQSGENGHHDFAWAYEAGTNASVSVTLIGVQYTLSGSGEGKKGTEHITPDDLY